MNGPMTCLACLTPQVFYLRYDLKDVPYFACDCCSLKIPAKSGLIIGSISLLSRTITELGEEFRKQAQIEAAKCIRGENIHRAIDANQINKDEIYTQREVKGRTLHNEYDEKRVWRGNGRQDQGRG